LNTSAWGTGRPSLSPPCLRRPNRHSGLMPKTNRWHPVMLPDDYLRKMKQDLSEVEAQVEAETRYESEIDSPPPPDDDGQLP
jgi:hypothetical protein